MENLTNTPNFLWLRDISYDKISQVGGKASSLGEMYNNLSDLGIKVPNAFTLTTHLFRQFMKNIQSQIDEIISEIDIDDPKSLKIHASKVRNIISNQDFSDDLKYDIIHEYLNLSAEYNQDFSDVAVRSSSVAEDLTDCSFAGMYDTFLNISNTDDLLHSIKKCYASLYNDRAILYRLKANTTFDDISLAVVVQKMVKSQSSGVAFTADVESSFSDVVVVNSSYGLCELVVQGEQIVPDEFVVYKPTLKKGYNAIVSKKLGDKKVEMVYSDSGVDIQPTTSRQQQSFSLTDDEVIQLATSCVNIEHHYQQKYNHRHIDVEFAKDAHNGEIYIADNCIGCGNCRDHCPYGVIQMSAVKKTKGSLLLWLLFGFGREPGDSNEWTGKKGQEQTRTKAVKCDMCLDDPRGAACVRACPTGAALRVHPEEFFRHQVNAGKRG